MATETETPPFHNRLPVGSAQSHSTPVPDTVRNAKSSMKCLGYKPFGFEARTGFDASQSLHQTRSNNFQRRIIPKKYEIWNRPAPDFRPQMYVPKPPKRNSRDAIQPWKYGSRSSQEDVQTSEEIKLPPLPQFQQFHNEKPPFATTFKPIGTYEAKLLLVKSMSDATEPYHNPEPPRFRENIGMRELGQPEFDTYHGHDPFNLKFHAGRLNIVHGPIHESQDRGVIRAVAPKTPQPPWEARLILKKGPWPEKCASLSRSRPVNRSAHSALMDRIQTRLNAEWEQEKML